MFKKILILILSLSISGLTLAAEEAAESEAAEEERLPLKYFLIAPNIMTFYQGTGKKLGYVVVQVQIVVRGDENLELVETHLPIMQDALIDFFNRQDKAVIRDQAKRKELQTNAELKVSEALQEEVGQDIIENLLFTQYIFQ